MEIDKRAIVLAAVVGTAMVGVGSNAVSGAETQVVQHDQSADDVITPAVIGVALYETPAILAEPAPITAPPRRYEKLDGLKPLRYGQGNSGLRNLHLNMHAGRPSR